jgi:hypothetical protein
MIDPTLKPKVQFPTVETAMIDPTKPSKIVKRTLNDVSPNEWDRVTHQYISKKSK